MRARVGWCQFLLTASIKACTYLDFFVLRLGK